MLTVSCRYSTTITPAVANLRRNVNQIKLMPFKKHETELYLRVMFSITNNGVTIYDRLLGVFRDRSNRRPLFIDCIVIGQ